MKASVVILNYNQSEILEYILYSLNNQNTKYEFEIIITDDGSNNQSIKNTFDIIGKYNNLSINFIFQQDKGFNITKARNNAIRMARGEIIITLDGDIIPDNDFIETHIKLHSKNEKLLVYSDRKFKNFSELSYETLYSESKYIDNKNIENDEKIMKSKSIKDWQKAWGFNTSFIKEDYTLYNEKINGWGLEDVEFAYKLEKIYEYKIINSNNMVLHINKDNEKIQNPYITKNKEHFNKFIDNAIVVIKTLKEASIELIKLLYVPNIQLEDKTLNNASLSFYNNYLMKYDITNNTKLYKKAVDELLKLKLL